MEWSLVVDASVLLFGLNATRRHSSWERRRACSLRFATFHILRVPVLAPATKVLPSALNAKATQPSKSVSVAKCFPVTLHNFISPASFPVASVFPSGLKLTDTSALCTDVAEGAARCLPVAPSQSLSP